MIQYTFATISTILDGEILKESHPEFLTNSLGYDTRSLISPGTALFFAINGKNHDGHTYLMDAYEKGVRNYVVEYTDVLSKWSIDAPINVIKVADSVLALQQLAAYHREEFNIPVLGITGSNGKTIVKEWLFQLLSPDFNIVRSPRSYNSQIGVPLSVWLCGEENNFAIFEAGISQPGEMERLEQIIQPTIGIFTNIGAAHQANFESLEQKASEKLKLFKNTDLLIYCRDYEIIQNLITEQMASGALNHDMICLDWSMHQADASIYIERETLPDNKSELIAYFEGVQHRLQVGFADRASIENLIHCWVMLLYLGVADHDIQIRMAKLHPIEMRLELKAGINGTTIINDSYNSDITSLAIALDTLNNQNQHAIKRLILSDIFESEKSGEALYQQVANILDQKGIKNWIGIGPELQKYAHLFHGEKSFYPATKTFLEQVDFRQFRQEAILLKGSRAFGFEAIARRLQQKSHQTILEINLSALTHNLNVYRNLLIPSTKIMAMVKAFSYGSGSYEIANILQFHKVDYLAVAYADEGVYLREQGINLPIMVMNPEESAFESIINHKLEPEIYSLNLLDAFVEAVEMYYTEIMPLPIHIKIDTGMRRLGFGKEDIDALLEKLTENKKLYVASVFSHLASADAAGHDDFTKHQSTLFENISSAIIEKLGYPVLKHILNSPGIARFPEYQFDMVRLGIGLYGIDPTQYVQNRLETVSTLKTHISQIRKVPKGESVGYSRRAVMERDSIIATIGIGYADGFPRALGNKNFSVSVNGSQAPVIGSVCMDMAMIDITDIQAQEGDEVLIFGPVKPIEQMAEALGTIPYEILTNVSQRVKRVYYKE